MAGPVAVAATYLPPDFDTFGIDDSKKLAPMMRENMAERIRRQSIFALRFCDNQCIDRIGILPATLLAMRQAVHAVARALGIPVNQVMVVVDGKIEIPGLNMLQKTWVKADSKSWAVAAGSIIAKTNRDHLMQWADTIYPEYGFIRHKGYGTAIHMNALREHGPCPLHRLSFSLPGRNL